jgi:hypothetical protein
MKKDDIPDLTASYFDAQHPLPAVCYTIFYSSCFSLIIICLVIFGLIFFQDHRLFVSRPSLPEGGAIPNVPVSTAYETPEAGDSQDGDEGEDSLERTSSTTSPPPVPSEDLVVDKKRKRVEDFASSSASAHKAVAGETPAPEDDLELFDLMDS